MMVVDKEKALAIAGEAKGVEYVRTVLPDQLLQEEKKAVTNDDEKQLSLFTNPY